MKNIIFILLLSISAQTKADGFYVFGGVYAYDDGNVSGTKADYDGISPDAYYGIKYIYDVTDRLFLSTGWKHQSSVSYREVGGGFQGVFADFNLKIF